MSAKRGIEIGEVWDGLVSATLNLNAPVSSRAIAGFLSVHPNTLKPHLKTLVELGWVSILDNATVLKMQVEGKIPPGSGRVFYNYSGEAAWVSNLLGKHETEAAINARLSPRDSWTRVGTGNQTAEPKDDPSLAKLLAAARAAKGETREMLWAAATDRARNLAIDYLLASGEVLSESAETREMIDDLTADILDPTGDGDTLAIWMASRFAPVHSEQPRAPKTSPPHQGHDGPIQRQTRGDDRTRQL